MSTIGIIILIFYILGCILCFYVMVKENRGHDDYLTLSECVWMLVFSLASWISIFVYVIVELGDKPIIKFKK